MAKRTVNEKELVDDIRFGMADHELMQKYALSQQLKALFDKFVEKGSVRVEELYRLEPIPSKPPAMEWECPVCHTPLINEFEVCSKCKV
jgi:hypothetical protein